jgi:hypothetical protein
VRKGENFAFALNYRNVIDNFGPTRSRTKEACFHRDPGCSITTIILAGVISVMGFQGAKTGGGFGSNVLSAE